MDIVDIFKISLDLPTIYFAYFSGCRASFAYSSHSILECYYLFSGVKLNIRSLCFIITRQIKVIKVNRQQQPRSARLRPIQKIPTPIKLLISPLPETINQICKKYSLENAQDKITSDDTCDTFQK